MLKRCVLLLLVLGIAYPAFAQAVQVRHDHDPWGACEGELVVDENGIQYVTDKEDHQKSWAWIDIQGFDRWSPERFSVLTYEDLKWHLGLDRNFDFTVLPGEAALEEAAFAIIERNLIRPVTDRIPKVDEPEYQVPVKHIHVFGGCEGVLTFGRDRVVYETTHVRDARSWGRDKHIANVWSSNPYELELRVFEENRRAFDKTTRFLFQLKEPLDVGYYERLRREFLILR